jgi:uncharacterized protein YaeQ
MALKATIFKAELQISDLDRAYYHQHALTVARHPSETDERMMMRILAFALFADESLAFGKGLSADDEPDLWRKDLTGDIDLWLEVGLPDERRVRKACGRATQVVVLAYGGRAVDVWWGQHASLLNRLENLRVMALPAEVTAALAVMAKRTMRLDCLVQDGQAWFSDEAQRIEILPLRLGGGYK